MRYSVYILIVLCLCATRLDAIRDHVIWEDSIHPFGGTVVSLFKEILSELLEYPNERILSVMSIIEVSLLLSASAVALFTNQMHPDEMLQYNTIFYQLGYTPNDIKESLRDLELKMDRWAQNRYRSKAVKCASLLEATYSPNDIRNLIELASLITRHREYGGGMQDDIMATVDALARQHVQHYIVGETAHRTFIENCFRGKPFDHSRYSMTHLVNKTISALVKTQPQAMENAVHIIAMQVKRIPLYATSKMIFTSYQLRRDINDFFSESRTDTYQLETKLSRLLEDLNENDKDSERRMMCKYYDEKSKMKGMKGKQGQLDYMDVAGTDAVDLKFSKLVGFLDEYLDTVKYGDAYAEMAFWMESNVRDAANPYVMLEKVKSFFEINVHHLLNVVMSKGYIEQLKRLLNSDAIPQRVIYSIHFGKHSGVSSDWGLIDRVIYD